MFSTDIMEVILGVSEGPIKGLKDGAKSFYIGDTPLIAQDDTANFDRFEIKSYLGHEVGQDIHSLIGGFGAAVNVGLRLERDVPVIRSGVQNNIDYLDVRINVAALYHISKKGAQKNHSGRIKIEYRRASVGTWQPVTTLTKLARREIPLVKGGYDVVEPIIVGDDDPSTVDPDAIFLKEDEGFAPYKGGIPFASPIHQWFTTLGAPFAVDSTADDGTVHKIWVNPITKQVSVWNGAAWVTPGSSVQYAGLDSTPVVDGIITISGKTTSGAVQEYRIPVENLSDDTYDVRVTKLNGHDGDKNIFEISWDSIGEISAKSFNFPGLAVTQVAGRSSDQLTSVPELSGIYEGRTIRVPSNYDPETRTYTGTWDGAWKIAYSNNPAYIGYDLVSNDRYGMSAYYPINLNKWDIYEAGRWCDVITADGTPRFTFNGLISNRMGCREAVNYIFGIFGGRFFDDGNGQAVVKIDQTSNPVAVFAPENVVDGVFNYSFTGISTHYNDITVQFTNPDLNWQTDQRRVFDQGHIDRYGRIPKSIQAVGCTNEKEAIRRGRYYLATSLSEKISVSFKTNRQGVFVQPYDLILIADPSLDFGWSGRVGTVVNASTISFRDPIFLEEGFDYQITFLLSTAGDGLQTFPMTLAAGQAGEVRRQLEVVGTLPAEVQADTQFSVGAVGDTNAAPKTFRVLSVTPGGDNDDDVTIEAIEHNRVKWDFVDGLVDTLPVDKTGSEANIAPLPVANFDVIAELVGEAMSHTLVWTPSPSNGVVNYKLQMSVDGNPFRDLGTTEGLELVIPSLPAGDYLFSIVPVNSRGLEGPVRYARFQSESDLEYDLPLIENLTGSAVTGITDDGIFRANIRATWQAVDVEGVVYDVVYQRSGETVPRRTEVTHNGFVSELLEGNSTYALSVSARIGDIELRSPTAISIVVPGDDTIPLRPVGWTGIPGIGQITLKGPVSTERDFKEFVIYSSETETGVYSQIATTAANEYIRTITDQLDHWYKIAQRDRSGNISPQTDPIQVSPLSFDSILDRDPPAVPTGLAVTSTLGTLSATWNANTEEDFAYYDVEVTEGAGNPISFQTATPHYEWTGIKAGISFSVRLRSVDRVGNKSAWSAAVLHTSMADTVPPATPTGLKLTAGFNTIWAEWNRNTEDDLDYYEVAAGTATNPTTIVARTPATSHALTELPDNATRYVRIRAVDTSGNVSGWTATLSKATVAAPDFEITTAKLSGLVDQTSLKSGFKINLDQISSDLDLHITSQGQSALADKQAAEAAKEAAETARTQAQTQAGLASDHAAAAAGHAATASTKADEAGDSAVAAAASAVTANTKAGEASTSATQAASSASDAAGAATTASSAAGVATNARNAAQGHASAAANSASTASTKATEAGTAASTATSWASIASTQAGIATTKAGEAATSASNAAGAVNEASSYAQLAALALSGGMAKNPTFMGWTGANPPNVLLNNRTSPNGTATQTPGKYGNAVLFDVTSNSALGAYLELSHALGHLSGNVNPQRLLVTLEVELLEGTPTGTTIQVGWLKADTGSWVWGGNVLIGPKLTAGVGIQTYQALVERPAYVTDSTDLRPRFFPSYNNAGGTYGACKIKLHRFDVQEVVADSFVDEQRQTKATLDGLTSSTYLMRVKAGGALAGFEMVAAGDPTGAASAIRMAADQIIMDGSVKAPHLDVGVVTADKLAVGFGGNLLTNTDFSAGTANWFILGTGDVHTQTSLSLHPPGDWAGSTYPTLRVFQNNVATDGYTDLTWRPRVNNSGQVGIGHPVKVDDWIEFSFSTSIHRCDVQLRLQWLSESDGTISYTPAITIPRRSGSTTNPELWTRSWIKAQAPAGAAYVRPHIRKFGTLTGTNSYLFIHKPMMAYSSAARTEPTPYAPDAVTLIDGATVLTDTLEARHMVKTAEILTTSAQIKDAIITNAKIANLSAAKLMAGTALAGSLTVNGTALGQMTDPAGLVNTGTTQIDPGKIRITGSTTLADWRKGGDETKIDGGAISANTIDANKVTVGVRGITLTGIQFEHNSPAANQVSWTEGSLRYVNDSNSPVAQAIAAGSATWTAGTLFIYWVKGASTLSTTTNLAVAMTANTVILASYAGGTNLNAEYGRTVIDEDGIKTGAVKAHHIEVEELSAVSGRMGVLEVNNRLTIADSGALMSFKAGPYDESDGLFFGQTGANGFALTASRTSASGVRQSVDLRDNGFTLLNARHVVSAQTYVPATTVYTNQTIQLPPGSVVFDLLLVGAGGGGSGTDGKGAVNPGGIGGDTTVTLRDGVTIIKIWTAQGGLGGNVSNSWTSPTGQASILSPGGKAGSQTRIGDGEYIYANGYSGADGSGGGAGHKATRGGMAGSSLDVAGWDVSQLVDPNIVISIGAGGAGGTGKTTLGQQGGKGGGGLVRYHVGVSGDIPADVVPLKPTAWGTFTKTGLNVTFPNLGSGIWSLFCDGDVNMDIGWVDVGDGREAFLHRGMTTFVSSKTPVRLRGGWSSNRTIHYNFYSMGSWT